LEFISTPWLKRLRALHLEPIKVVFSDQIISPNLGNGFTLICFQRLSKTRRSYPAFTLGRITGTPEVYPFRSSRQVALIFL